MTERMHSTTVLQVAIAMCLGTTACSSAASDEHLWAEGRVGVAGQALTSAPSEGYFADVTAEGSGCPQGSWSTEISPDGEVVTIVFSAYELDLTPGTERITKDCDLAITVAPQRGRSYSLSSMSYSGYRFLERGVSARMAIDYAFDESSVRSTTHELSGPLDEEYLVVDEFEPADGVLSRCGAESTLHVRTELDLENDECHEGSGYINVSALDGSAELVLDLESHTCECEDDE
jgi:hypothetical protein